MPPKKGPKHVIRVVREILARLIARNSLKVGARDAYNVARRASRLRDCDFFATGTNARCLGLGLRRDSGYARRSA